MFRQRIAGNGLLGCLRQINIIGDILDVPPVIHPGEEELLGVAENDWANNRPLEPAVLLDDANDPRAEFAQLSIELADKLLASGDVERARNLLENHPLPFAARQCDDVLPSIVGDEESGQFLQGLVGFRDVGQIEVGDPASDRQSGMPADKPLFVTRRSGRPFSTARKIVFAKC